MHKNAVISLLLGLTMATQAAFSATSPVDPCGPPAVGAFISTHLNGLPWNKGSVRAWEQSGEFWSLPFPDQITQVAHAVETHFQSICDVVIADVGSFTARVMPKGSFKKPSKAMVQEILHAKSEKPNPDDPDAVNIVSKVGTTIGVFEPSKGEKIMIMYPARIAAAMARGTGKSKQNDLKDVEAKFPAELDIEYNFGGFAIRVFGGTGKSTMREAADQVFATLRRWNYLPAPGSEKSIAAFDRLFPPDVHESFWLNENGIARVELAKLKNGNVRLNIHETKSQQRQ